MTSLHARQHVCLFHSLLIIHNASFTKALWTRCTTRVVLSSGTSRRNFHLNFQIYTHTHTSTQLNRIFNPGIIISSLKDFAFCTELDGDSCLSSQRQGLAPQPLRRWFIAQKWWMTVSQCLLCAIHPPCPLASDGQPFPSGLTPPALIDDRPTNFWGAFLFFATSFCKHLYSEMSIYFKSTCSFIVLNLNIIKKMNSNCVFFVLKILTRIHAVYKIYTWYMYICVYNKKTFNYI